MRIVVKDNVNELAVEKLKEELKIHKLDVSSVDGYNNSVWNIEGETSKITDKQILNYGVVYAILRENESYQETDRAFHPNDTIIDVSGIKVGNGYFQVIAGPCAIENENQIIHIAEQVKKSGASMLRGGAYKPRTSPYSFQGLREEGLKLLLEAKRITGLPVVSEITRLESIDLFDSVDVIQVGARNMQNYELLKELGKLQKTILLKRGFCNTIDELLMSAEYIMAGGNKNVILCERGIRTFEPSMRNTLDISAIPMIKSKSHLPVIVDPSHAGGIRKLVEPLTLASLVAGADGAIIEVHDNPDNALCDGEQSLTCEMFDDMMSKINGLAYFMRLNLKK